MREFINLIVECKNQIVFNCFFSLFIENFCLKMKKSEKNFTSEVVDKMFEIKQ